MPLAICSETIGVAQWYTYRPGFSALKVIDFSCPGATCSAAAPPPGPVVAWKSTEWIIALSAEFFR